MEIYPALDLLNGDCVRLRKGNFLDKKIYSDDPLAIIQSLKESGANFLHLVDLNGAENPKKRQLDLLRTLISKTNLKIQCGGGIRSHENVRSLLELGVDRVCLGSITLMDPETTISILKEYSPKRITLALDLRIDSEGFCQIASHGLKTFHDRNVFDLIRSYQENGATRFLCTDIDQDGMMNGPNLDLYKGLVARFPTAEIQASGGCSSLDDLTELKRIGVHSVIVGKALYEGRIPIRKAFELCSQNE